MKTFWKVSDVARVLDIHVETVRRWDRRGEFKSTGTDTTGHRLYLPTAVNKLKKQRDKCKLKKKK